MDTLNHKLFNIVFPENAGTEIDEESSRNTVFSIFNKNKYDTYDQESTTSLSKTVNEETSPIRESLKFINE